MDHSFKNREEAAGLLAEKLIDYRNTDAVVLAIARGGVPIGAILAQMLQLPLEIALSKKLGHPRHAEFAIGAVSIEASIVDRSLGVSEAYFETEIPKIQEELKEQYKELKGKIPSVDIKNKTVIVVDDGIATGHTMSATVKMIKNKEVMQIVIAVPVIAPLAAAILEKEVEKVISLKTPPHFRSIGQFYNDFEPVSDTRVSELLNQASAKRINKH